jgi:membrane-bound lytic murein transglycosylase B
LATLLLLPAAGATAAETDFPTWLAAFRSQAAAHGVRPGLLDSTLAHLQPVTTVLEQERRQPEVTITLARYLRGAVSPGRVARGRYLKQQHQELLARVSGRYHVQPRFLMALWGLETDYGANMGRTPVIPALATLAWSGRRPELFRQELLAALELLNQGWAQRPQLVGSWAGAMGQPQFMPSTLLAAGVDFDQDNRRDIWGTVPDVLASAANLLASLGWRDDQTWGREVRLPASVPAAWDSTTQALSEWQRLGVRQVDGDPLPELDLAARLVRPARGNGRAFLTYGNFQAIKRWNNSTYFAIAIGQLADRIGD